MSQRGTTSLAAPATRRSDRLTMRRMVVLAGMVAVVAACSGSSTPGTGATTSAPVTLLAGALPTSPLPAATEATQSTTLAGTTTSTSPTPSGPWTVDALTCPDLAAASAPITGTLTIVAAVPLSGGVAAAQWKPVVDGFRTAIDFANFNHVLGDLSLQLKLVDDRFDADLTVDAIQPELDKGAQVVAGVVGTADNLAARFTLNEQCVPQLLGFTASPQLGDVAGFPWTMGALPPVAVELGALATLVRTQLPGGGTLGIYASADDLGDAYAAAAKATAPTVDLSVVATEQVAADAALPATAQIGELAAARPDVVFAAPDGLDCTYFLRELARQRSTAIDWRPVVLLAGGCASDAVLGLAGPAADGIYSTSNLVDIGNQANSSLPGVGTYATWMNGAGLNAEAAAAAPGWTAGETLVAIVRQAIAAPAGLSRVSIIEAARALDVTPTLGRPGVQFRTNGASDPFLAQSLQVIRWSAPARGFVEVGPLVTAFES